MNFERERDEESGVERRSDMEKEREKERERESKKMDDDTDGEEKVNISPLSLSQSSISPHSIYSMEITRQTVSVLKRI